MAKRKKKIEKIPSIIMTVDSKPMINNSLAEITFDEPQHKYFDKSGKELISVGSLIQKYCQPFDPTGSIIKKCAEKRNISVEELRAEWEKTKNDACIRGTSLHSQMEHYVITGQILDQPNKDIVEQFAKFEFKGQLFSEQIVYSLKDGVAGTVDLIDLYNNNQTQLWDFKTNKILNKFAFGKKMYYPLNHLDDSIFNHYQLQLNLYAYLLEQHGYWVNNMNIFYIKPKTRKIEIHPMENLHQEIVNMIAHYKGELKSSPKVEEDFF